MLVMGVVMVMLVMVLFNVFCRINSSDTYERYASEKTYSFACELMCGWSDFCEKKRVITTYLHALRVCAHVCRGACGGGDACGGVCGACGGASCDCASSCGRLSCGRLSCDRASWETLWVQRCT
jgi:hypothetical protein